LKDIIVGNGLPKMIWAKILDPKLRFSWASTNQLLVQFERRNLRFRPPIDTCLGGYLHGMKLEFSRRGKPTDNGLIEALNGRLRAECLIDNWFLSLDDVRQKVEAWRRHYDLDRPHSAMGFLTPREFAASNRQVGLTG